MRAADPRIVGHRVVPTTATASREVAVVTTTGIRAASAGDLRATCRPTPWPTEGDETQTGYGFSVGREPAELDVDGGAAEVARARHPPARRHQAARPHGCTVVLDPCVTAQFLGILGFALSAARPC